MGSWMSSSGKRLGMDARRVPGDLLGFLLNGPNLIPITLVWALLLLGLVPNATSAVGEVEGPRLQVMAMFYVGFVVFFLVVNKVTKTPLDKVPIWQFALEASGVFVMSAILLVVVFETIHVHPPRLPTGTTSNAWTGVSFFVIAFPEELVFRHSLPLVFLKTKAARTPLVAQIASSAIFAIYHFTAYGGNPWSMLWAFGFGIGFGIVREYAFPGRGSLNGEPHGLIAAIGAHGTYDAFVLGGIKIFGSLVGGTP